MTEQDLHSKIDADYHDATASQYEDIVNEPRRFANDLLFNPLLKSIDSPIKSVLDLGCGTGQMVERLAFRFEPQEIIAVDHSAGMLDIAAAKADSLRLSNVRFVRADVSNFIADESSQFDLISCVGVLHHLTLSNCERLIQDCFNRVTPGGWLLVAEPVNRSTLKNFPAWLDKWNRRSVLAGKEIRSEVPEPDEAPLPEGFLSEQLVKAGFSVVNRSCGMEIFPLSMPPSLIDRVVIWITSRVYRKSGFIVATLAKRDY